MNDFFNSSNFYLFIGIIAAGLSLFWINKSGEKKANYDKNEVITYTKTAVDKSVEETIKEFNNQLSVVLEAINTNARSNLDALNIQGQKIITDLQKDLEKTSEGTLKNLEELKLYSERLKLEKPVFLSTKYTISKDLLPKDPNGYKPDLTSEYLSNYISSSNYKLRIFRRNKINNKEQLVAVYSCEGNELKFDKNSFTSSMNNSLKLVSPDYYEGPSDQVEYTINLKFNSSIIGDFSSLAIGDRIYLDLRIQDISQISESKIYRLDQNSIESTDIYLNTSFNQRYKLRLLKKWARGSDMMSDRNHGIVEFEIIE